ncbi:MAG: Hpt domain-containing protein [Bdellovibrionales bacterium]|nr:Hpt domain-containing protein [Bdellovibrionales bacterium]
MSAGQLLEVLDDCAILVVMMSAGDPTSLELVADNLTELRKQDAWSDYPNMATSLSQVLEINRSAEPAVFIQAVADFISHAQSALSGKGDIAVKSDSPSNWAGDLAATADAELIVEFIEKHTSLLDDFEARILQEVDASEEGSEDELQGFLKSYLHNVKGDAGSVGLLGVEKVTHWCEDQLLDHGPKALTELLLAYKEWVLSLCKAYSEGSAPSEFALDFIECWKGVVGNEKERPTDTEHERGETHPKEGQPVEVPKPFQSEEYSISGDTDILSEFLIEAEDHLSQVESMLLDAGRAYSLEDLDAIFRAVHSIKGGSAYFSLREITETSHITESFMDKARDGKIIFNTVLQEIVLEYVGLQRELLQNAREAMTNGTALRTCEQVFRYKQRIEDYLLSVALVSEFESGAEVKDVPEMPQTTDAAEAIEIKEARRVPELDPIAVREEKHVQPVTKQSETEAVHQAEREQDKKVPEKVKVKNYVKIETERLDHLIEYIGEMVISSSMLIRNCRDLLGENEAVLSNSNQLERISREIQDLGMSMRLIPIKGLFQKMSRVVWDTAKKLKKDVRFEMEGEDTELDRSVIDKLADPLMHMVRNAVDHGVESIQERQAAGKPKQGVVKLSAYHSGGSIYIEITDDGKGLNREKLLAKAIEKGLVSSGDKLSDEEVYMLIFAAGFSTAEKVTDVSGRGVGMDVVRRNIESMRGRVSIASTLGGGSIFTIELPLTLAIVEGIETRIGSQSFIIPSLSVVEFLRPTPDMLMHALDKAETLKFRGQFLPLYRVAETYGLHPRATDPCDRIVMIVEVAGRLAALLVDDVLGKISAVIKGLGDLYKEVEGVSGCAILPDGAIGLILDVGTFVSLAKRYETQAIPDSRLLGPTLGEC